MSNDRLQSAVTNINQSAVIFCKAGFTYVQPQVRAWGTVRVWSPVQLRVRSEFWTELTHEPDPNMHKTLLKSTLRLPWTCVNWLNWDPVTLTCHENRMPHPSHIYVNPAKNSNILKTIWLMHFYKLSLPSLLLNRSDSSIIYLASHRGTSPYLGISIIWKYQDISRLCHPQLQTNIQY